MSRLSICSVPGFLPSVRLFTCVIRALNTGAASSTVGGCGRERPRGLPTSSAGSLQVCRGCVLRQEAEGPTFSRCPQVSAVDPRPYAVSALQPSPGQLWAGFPLFFNGHIKSKGIYRCYLCLPILWWGALSSWKREHGPGCILLQEEGENSQCINPVSFPEDVPRVSGPCGGTVLRAPVARQLSDRFLDIRKLSLSRHICSQQKSLQSRTWSHRSNTEASV